MPSGQSSDPSSDGGCDTGDSNGDGPSRMASILQRKCERTCATCGLLLQHARPRYGMHLHNSHTHAYVNASESSRCSHATASCTQAASGVASHSCSPRWALKVPPLKSPSLRCKRECHARPYDVTHQLRATATRACSAWCERAAALSRTVETRKIGSNQMIGHRHGPSRLATTCAKP